MQTNIHPDLLQRQDVAEADDILRTCVHCGFCTAVCPTYQLLGDELDGPRGRIYLIKNMLEANGISPGEVRHLDRCLTCRACETACPSGVEYGRLLDIGRTVIQETTRRTVFFRVLSWMLRHIVPYRTRFTFLLRLGQTLKPILPRRIARKVPDKAGCDIPKGSYGNKLAEGGKLTKQILLLNGCVQGAATPGVNRSLVRLLERHNIGVQMLEAESCCGAVDYHLSAHEAGRKRMRELIDQIHPRLGEVDAVVSTASGCGATIKEYPAILQGEPDWESKAKDVVNKVIDVSELLAKYSFDCHPIKAAFHIPCTLQHGQKITGVVESILTQAGIELTAVNESHLCCGSAGTYSIMQPKLAESLLQRKAANLEANSPEIIATANVGCQMHLQSGTDVPVMHWVELLERQLKPVHAAEKLPASR